MKNLKFILVAGLMAVSAPAFAQFANTGNAGNNRSASSTSIENGYSRLEAAYNPVTLKWDDSDDDEKMTGISLGYIKGFSISKSMPLYVETGLRFTYAFWSDEEDNTESKMTYMNLSVPINLAYRFAIPNSEIAITPFVGLTLKGNLIGKSEYEYSYDDETEKSETNWFDEKYDDEDEYDEDKDYGYGAKRIQFGWNIGANVSYNKFNVGICYGSDFSELWKETKTSNLAVSVGYSF